MNQLEATSRSVSAQPSAWTEGDVRRLLKAVRRPSSLPSSPLAAALARAYRSSDPLDAVRRFVREALGGGGIVGRRLLEVIERCDFQADVPMTTVAHELGMSPRQLFRYRREAVQALRRRADAIAAGTAAEPQALITRLARLVGATDPDGARVMFGIAGESTIGDIARLDACVNAGSVRDDDLPTSPQKRLLALCRIARGAVVYGDPFAARKVTSHVRKVLAPRHPMPDTDAIRFELAWLSYLDLRFGSPAELGLSAASTLPILAGNDRALARRAHLYLAEARMRCGDIEGAQHAIDCVQELTPPSDISMSALVLCLRGGRAMLDQRFDLADDCYSAASIVLDKRTVDRWVTQTFIGSARLMRRMSWAPAPEALAVEPLDWGRLVIDDDVVQLPTTTAAAPARISLALLAARSAIQQGFDLEAVERDLDELLEMSRRVDYNILTAGGLAVRVELDLALGRVVDARRRIVEAVTEWMISADRAAAVDLFSFDEAEWEAAVFENDGLAEAIADWCDGLSRAGDRPASSLAVVKQLLSSRYVDSQGPVDWRDPLACAVAMTLPWQWRASASSAALDL
ncbi:MAG TPA: hypothetical protein VID24_00055 [Candidatus Eremiobacteraceae bacterium]